MKITRVETMALTLPMVIDGATPMLGGSARTSIDMLPQGPGLGVDPDPRLLAKLRRA